MVAAHILISGTEVSAAPVRAAIAGSWAVVLLAGISTVAPIARMPRAVLDRLSPRRAEEVTVAVDPGQCGSFGFCEQEAPGIFTLRSDQRLAYRSVVASDQAEAAMRAAVVCPARAIKLGRLPATVVVAPAEPEPVEAVAPARTPVPAPAMVRPARPVRPPAAAPAPATRPTSRRGPAGPPRRRPGAGARAGSRRAGIRRPSWRTPAGTTSARCAGSPAAGGRPGMTGVPRTCGWPAGSRVRTARPDRRGRHRRGRLERGRRAAPVRLRRRAGRDRRRAGPPVRPDRLLQGPAQRAAAAEGHHPRPARPPGGELADRHPRRRHRPVRAPAAARHWRTLAYDGLVIASGTKATLPRGWPTGPGMHLLHDLADARALRSALAGTSSVAVVGGGLTGCEVACAVTEMARSAVLVNSHRFLMPRSVGEPIGALITAAHLASGLDVRLGRKVADAESRRTGWRLLLDSGETVSADLVVVTAGEQPDVGWLASTPADTQTACSATRRCGWSGWTASSPPGRWLAGPNPRHGNAAPAGSASGSWRWSRAGPLPGRCSPATTHRR